MRFFALSILLLTLAAGLFAADEISTFAKHWNTSGEFTVAVAEAMPAGDFNFAPNADEMGFGKLMIHVTGYNNMLFATVSGMKAPVMPPAMAAAMKDAKGVFDKDATIQFVRDSFAFCSQALKEITPAKMEEMFGPEGRQASGREFLWRGFTHTAHHRGQAEVYLRVKNIKPPGYKF